MSISFVLNGKSTTLDADPNMPLLWAVREVVGLPGTKFGCGMALCGACTVHLDGQAIRSCVMPLRAVGAGITGVAQTNVHCSNLGPIRTGHERRRPCGRSRRWRLPQSLRHRVRS